MIGKNVYDGKRTYVCDDCQKIVERFRSYQEAITQGWAISRNRIKCYCPNCAPFRRNVGRKGTKRVIVQLNINLL
jgi:hypothetical protein